ncbi:RagB/SusD family nutrient uptake outer membrane protein [Pedobacter glucosidilyticus]|uniref:RagB/SusD family nutrient uptake outer membrane protein n=1 Tax=Pedobacter glucosidilyticus TaxID=1122941 RepID=UPI0026EE897C|nr:RagB/SusD family nutrient uptake outer membrane protein [Pedobacter glucosidilyticus]
MMKAKYISSFIIGLSSLVMLNSCNSALDRDPLTQYGSDNFWNEPAQASAVLTGTYLRLQTALNTEFFFYGDSRSDICGLYLENNTQNIAVIFNRLDANLPVTDWGNFYVIINQANLIIKNVKIMNDKGLYVGRTTEYNRVLGQAYALRALAYFYLVRVWGDVPLITEPVENPSDLNALKTPRVAKDTVFNRISTDLRLARDLVPTSYSDAQQTRATITRGAVDAIMTDYCMWKNDPDSVITTSARVISNTQYGLTALYDPNIDYYTLPQVEVDKTEYSKMFTDGFSKESILEIAYNNDENTLSGLLTLFGGGQGVAQFFADRDLVTSYRSGDLRTVAHFKNENQIYKNFPKGTFDRVTENDKNVILYRLSDILLLRAEALVKTNQRSAAWTLIKQVRERAFGPVEVETLVPGSNPARYVINNPNPYNRLNTGVTSNSERAAFLALSNDAAEDYILEERKKELCFEGKRWFDLVRTGKVIQVMQNRTNGKITNPANILWPINLNIIRQNPNIEQNDFYK